MVYRSVTVHIETVQAGFGGNMSRATKVGNLNILLLSTKLALVKKHLVKFFL